jgi:hypothetical protein
VVYARVGEDLVPDDGNHLEGRLRGHRIDTDVAMPGRRRGRGYQMYFVVSLAKGREIAS